MKKKLQRVTASSGMSWVVITLLTGLATTVITILQKWIAMQNGS